MVRRGSSVRVRSAALGAPLPTDDREDTGSAPTHPGRPPGREVMAHAGQELVGANGARLRLVSIDPELLEMEASYPGDGALPPEHFHPRQHERFEVLDGTVRAIIDGTEQRFGPGDTFDVPAGTRHQMAAKPRRASAGRCGPPCAPRSSSRPSTREPPAPTSSTSSARRSGSPATSVCPRPPSWEAARCGRLSGVRRRRCARAHGRRPGVPPRCKPAGAGSPHASG
jgi:mannose-6-phosphate isomerase-like protein (cupin superfamily)